MIRITQQDSATAAKRYYATADYYSEGQELVGSWGGKGASRLGLAGTVDKFSFERLCDNLDPRTGEPLTVRTRTERTVGYDFTFSVPKSVSLLYAMSGDQDILDAFRAAVDETMREMEAEMKTRVRRAARMTDRTTGNMVWAEFIHTTSRPVDGLPDPQLHAHVFVFNTTWDEEERRWKAGQFRGTEAGCPVLPGGIPGAAGEQAPGPGLRGRAEAGRFRDRRHPDGCAETLLAAHGPDREGGRGEGHHRSRPQGGTRGRDPRKERQAARAGNRCARNGTRA